VIWRRIQLRKAKERTGAALRLKDFFARRTASILIGDIIANGLGIPNVVIAVKHPAKTIYGVSIGAKRPKFYLSFPITNVRRDPEARKEIDSFRAKAHIKLMAFDPLTMDERVLRTGERRGNIVVVHAEDRWLLPAGIKPAVEDEAELYSMEIPVEQVEEVLGDIDNIILD